MKKVYVLTIEFNSETDQVEYIQEEIIDESPLYKYGDLILDDYFDDEALELISESYIVGES